MARLRMRFVDCLSARAISLVVSRAKATNGHFTSHIGVRARRVSGIHKAKAKATTTNSRRTLHNSRQFAFSSCVSECVSDRSAQPKDDELVY